MKKVSPQIEAAAAWKNAFPGMQKKINRAAEAAFLAAKKSAVFKRRSFEINIVLTSDATIKRLNNFWRGKNKPTNVLSFPQIDPAHVSARMLDSFPARQPVPLGDIILALQTIKREVREQGKPLENHVIHLIVHGTLHLLGYDHMRPKEAKAMENLECDILKKLGYPDPYHATHD